jgi:translation elongation factor EF-Tu-like GTPase
MIGTLLEVFEISGRGCVVLVDIESGSCRVGDQLSIGSAEWPITGIDMPNYTPETLERIRRGWKPPTGILLGGAEKNELIERIGEQCRTADEKGASR